MEKKSGKETFVVEVQEQKRIAIPKVIYDLMKLKKGDKVRVSVEKV